MITDLLGETVLEDYAEWRETFIEEKDVITHKSDVTPPWTAFTGGWQHLTEFCSVMEDSNELRHGVSEREALEKLASCQKYHLYKG